MSIKISGVEVINSSRNASFSKISLPPLTIAQIKAKTGNKVGDTVFCSELNGGKGGLVSWTGTKWNFPEFNISGGETWTSGSYKYHQFTTNASIQATFPGTVEALIIAGGGGGGAGRDGGGGGAGGVALTAVSITMGNTPVVVGQGGAAMPAWPGYSLGNPHADGTRGTPSYIGSTVAEGGGSVGGWPSPNIRPGGSGAGGAFVEPGGSAVNPAYGNPGGTGTNIGGDPENSNTCGGGGGWGGAGESGSSPTRVPGIGGRGRTISELGPLSPVYPGVAWDIPGAPTDPKWSNGFAGGGSGHGGTWPSNPGRRPANPIGGGGYGQ